MKLGLKYNQKRDLGFKEAAASFCKWTFFTSHIKRKDGKQSLHITKFIHHLSPRSAQIELEF
jgi:hypothetical protein